MRLEKPIPPPPYSSALEFLRTAHGVWMIYKDGTMYRGNKDGFTVDGEFGVEVDPALSEQIRALFSTFELELNGTPVDAIDDPETLEALKALGYAE